MSNSGPGDGVCCTWQPACLLQAPWSGCSSSAAWTSMVRLHQRVHMPASQLHVSYMPYLPRARSRSVVTVLLGCISWPQLFADRWQTLFC